jgi:hypothetical protein
MFCSVEMYARPSAEAGNYVPRKAIPRRIFSQPGMSALKVTLCTKAREADSGTELFAAKLPFDSLARNHDVM